MGGSRVQGRPGWFHALFEGYGKRNEIPIMDLGSFSTKVYLLQVCFSLRTHPKKREDSGVFIFEIKPSGVEKGEEEGEGQNLSQDLKQSWGWIYPGSSVLVSFTGAG